MKMMIRKAAKLHSTFNMPTRIFIYNMPERCKPMLKIHKIRYFSTNKS